MVEFTMEQENKNDVIELVARELQTYDRNE